MNYFVYVVCGAKEYIEQLNFSIKFLRYFSKYPILVVTDSLRNEAIIDHSNIIDIKTPGYLNHHEASIYLETSLHKYLVLENNKYFYIDSDMVAVNENINEVFDYKTDAILFVKDHCNITQHSPHAIKCDCLQKQTKKKRNICQSNAIIAFYHKR